MARRAGRRGAATVLLALLAAGALAAPAQAQTLEPPRPRQGYYLSLGWHETLSSVHEKGRSQGTWWGRGTSVRIGQLLTRRLGMGLALDLGQTAGGGQTAGLYALAIEAHFELLTGLAVRAGTGLGVIALKDTQDPMATLRGNYGAAFSLGASYAWFPFARQQSGGFAVMPFVQAQALPGGSVWGLAAFAGVELAYWTGLPRHQLDLPESAAYGRH